MAEFPENRLQTMQPGPLITVAIITPVITASPCAGTQSDIRVRRNIGNPQFARGMMKEEGHYVQASSPAVLAAP